MKKKNILLVLLKELLCKGKNSPFNNVLESLQGRLSMTN